MRKSFWLLSAGMFALATPVHAQDNTQSTGETTPTEEAAEVNPALDVSPTDEVGTGVEDEIIVTAQGRQQILQDVPLAVSAVSAETLQNTGATDIRQLNQVAPSLLVSSTGTEANGSARIRGIGTVGDNPGLESSVAVFIDGVYRSRSGIGLNELGEIERIEVLRGPQGTLFGRNASAGLIHIISKKPNLNEMEGYAEATYGNYDFIRLGGGITGPVTETLGYRLDGVYAKRDGFYTDTNNGTDINDRNRYFVRGQMLYEPTDTLELRLIGDYTKRDEKCCAAVYLNRDINPLIGNLNNPATPLLQPGGVPARVNDNGNNIINVLRDLGQPLTAYEDPYSRSVFVTPGRSYAADTKDWGLSLQADWDIGGATLTSISAYRDYRAEQAGDIDYSSVDILYRAPNGAAREFQTFSQELRLQGSAFDDRLDWLVGAYYADEDLTVTDNLRFGSQYGRFATCRIISGSSFAPLYSPASPACLAARPPAAFGPPTPIFYAALDRLDSINDRGSTSDEYFQNSRNYAFFTHNIFKLTDELSVTVGLRYTNERKRLRATFGNDNTFCTANQASLTPFLVAPQPLAAAAAAIIGLSCQGNSTAELNGVTITDRRSEDEFTGTGILSYKPNPDLLLYASYSRGYKAGGFNLDRSALKAPIVFTPTGAPTTTFAAVGGAQALVGNLQFDPEINDAFEIGLKYSSGPITFNIAAFRQQFSNFQLNTFNGTVFLVQTVNGCTEDLGGADRDQSVLPGAPNYVPPAPPGNANPAAASGACDPSNVDYGVVSQGIEIEASVRPMRDLILNAGISLIDTKYRDNLVGNDEGTPLDPALRVLPGNNLSNAPETVFTGSFAWTPDIGGTGLSGLVYMDARVTSDFNTGSDLFPQKEEDSFAVINARLGVRGPEERWAIEVWAQNLFNEDYAQVAFNSPFQAGSTGTPPFFAPGFTAAPFVDPQFPGGRQIFSAFLAEPRTYGITVRTRF